jgi:hypothetical protein
MEIIAAASKRLITHPYALIAINKTPTKLDTCVLKENLIFILFQLERDLCTYHFYDLAYSLQCAQVTTSNNL